MAMRLSCSRPVVAAVCLLTAATCRAQIGIELRAAGVAAVFDPVHGTLVRTEHWQGGMTTIADPASAQNFRLALQKPDKATVSILGKDQALTGHRVEGDKLTLEWAGPLTDTAGARHDVSVRMTVTAADNALTFGLHVDNRSGLKLAEALYPFVGGLTRFDTRDRSSDATLWAPASTPIERAAQPTAGGATWGYPGGLIMPFACLRSKAAGTTLYVGAHDPVARAKHLRFIETRTPNGTELAFALQHMPLLPSGQPFDGAPVVLTAVKGDWDAAAKVYRDWFASTFGIVQPKDDWIRRQSFFLMTMFMLPEGTISYTFKDIPRWARAAKECGLGAVQISGWQLGGHDNGYPFYEPDPRLGTWKELEEGIRTCHKLGLKVYFFANYQPMMVDSDWYKATGSKYREVAADGGYTWMAGWGMGTLWARAGHPKLMTWANLAFPQFRKVIVDYFVKLASIGGDGVHVDKMFPTAIDYNPDSPLPPDTATWEGAILLSKEIMAACRKVNPDWCMSFECNWDRMLQFGGATWWVGNQLITRKVFPENAETTGLYQAWDYLTVNNLVRDGHIVMVAPLNFSRGVEWAPFRDLARYIRQVKAIRDQLADTVFYGEVLGQALVTLPGGPPDGIAYTVHRNRTTGRRACIVTNSRMEARTLAFPGFDGAASAGLRVYEPGQKPRTLAAPCELTVRAERLVFVEELAERTGWDARPTTAERTGTEAHPTTATRTGTEAHRTTATVPANGGFETGDFTGWEADPNWVVVDNSCGYYSGWAGKYWAWSGGKGEPALGKLRSKPFVMSKEAVRMLISGWGSIHGTGQPRHWNYVALKLEDGTEVDRVWAPDTTQFVPVFLDGSKVRGKRVTIEAVDDADQPTYSMLCIDDVRLADFPADQKQPVKRLPVFDAQRSVRLEDANLAIDVSRANGSITRVRDKKSGLDLILEPRLAGSFRFALPIPGKEPWQTIEANWIFGKDQKLTSHTLEGNTLTLHWDAPLRNYLGEPFDASATMTIELRDGGALLSFAVDTPPNYGVGETYFPVLGGLQGLGATRGQLRGTEFVRPAGPAPATTSADIFRSFANMAPFGDQGPEQFYAYPGTIPAPWVGFAAPKVGRGVLIAARDPRNRELFARMELIPASAGTPRDDGNWPRPSELKGMPIGVELSFVDTKGGAVGRRYEAAPVFVRFVEGSAAELANEYGRLIAKP